MNYADTVKHNDPQINGGQEMSVLEENEDGSQVLCSLNDGSEEWFNAADLTFIKGSAGDFI